MNHAAFLPSPPADEATHADCGTNDHVASTGNARSDEASRGREQGVAEAVRRVVLDTQIVMDWLVFEEQRVMPIITLVESRHLLWTATEAMKAEMLHVLGRGVASRYAPNLDRIHAAFATHCEFVDEPVLAMSRPRCSDEDDQKFIDLGLHLVTRGPAILISRDRAVLKVAKRAARLGLEIVNPDAWIKRQVTMGVRHPDAPV